MPAIDARTYWEARYAAGGDSGYGSRGRLAGFKASFLNAFVARERVRSVIELGCGDGGQLSRAEYPAYLGFDVSPTAIRICSDRFRGDPTRSFQVLDPRLLDTESIDPGGHRPGPRAELGLSLDVLYHLVDDDDFAAHLRCLFAMSERFAIIYSTNTELRLSGQAPHVRHRTFTAWIAGNQRDWSLWRWVVNPYDPEPGEGTIAYPDFFVYRRS